MAALDNNTNQENKPVIIPIETSQSSSSLTSDSVNHNQPSQEKAKPINLLPTEFKPNKSIVDLSKKLNRIAIGSLVVFLILGITSLASIFIINARANSLEDDVVSLSSEVTALEQTEQRLILIKDRVRKVGMINSDSSSLSDTVLVYKQLYDNLPSGLQINSANIENKQITSEIVFNNSSELARFLAQTVTSRNYNLINIQNLSTGQNGGLVMTIVLGA